MPKVTIQSNKYPGVQFAHGIPYYAAGSTYEVTAEQFADIKTQYATFDQGVKKYLNVYFEDDAQVANTIAIANPVPPPAPVPVEETVPPVEDISEDELTDEDLDLIAVEVNKLLGKTIAQAEPILIATGTNAQLPRTLRRFYLQEVIAHGEIQKTLKDKAQEILEQV